jgi:hypothetical protein
MQMLGSVGFLVAGVAAVSALSVSLYAALPKSLLAHAERHGRFQGLSAGERLADGTRAGQPPPAAVRPSHAGLAQGNAAQGLAG